MFGLTLNYYPHSVGGIYIIGENMKKQYLETGKIVGTHGIKGMTRVQVWADDNEFLGQFKFVYTDENGNGKLEISRVQPHGTVALVAFKGVNTIEQAEKLRGTVIYINRKDAKLPEGRYFITDLLGCEVFDADTNELLGKITDVSETGANDVWHITKDDKEYLVPAIADVIVTVDTENEKAVIRPMKGIFDED
jgi:16S rRNA processing protein RimM